MCGFVQKKFSSQFYSSSGDVVSFAFYLKASHPHRPYLFVMATNQHIPAWKRLGLKLKFANDTPVLPLSHTDTNGSQNGLSAKKRKASLSAEVDSSTTKFVPPAKKPKKQPKIACSSQTATFTESSQSSALTPTLASVELASSTNLPQDPSLVSTASPTAKKRKSVSFAPETKAQDGDSTKQLYTAWLAHQDEDFSPATAAQALRHVSPPKIHPSTLPDTTTSPKAPPVKKAKLSKKERLKLSAEASAPIPITATLQYLQSYHTSRSSWKFNKSKQNQVLKHAFDTIKIPRSYDRALAAYMEGLEKTSNACKRLREEALAVRAADEEVEAEASDDVDTETTADDEGEESDNEEDTEDDSDNEEEEDAEIDPEVAAKAKATKQAAKAVKAKRRMSEPIKKKYYRQALQKYKAQLKEKLLLQEERDRLADPVWRDRLLKRKRAELVLWSIGEDDFGPQGMYQKMAPGATVDSLFKPGTVQLVDATGGKVGPVGGRAETGKGANVVGKRKRKRKRRTGVPDDDSSEEVSSSSDSEAEGKEQVKEMSVISLSSFDSDVGGDVAAEEVEEASGSGSGSGSEGEGSDSGSGDDSGSDSDDSD